MSSHSLDYCTRQLGKAEELLETYKTFNAETWMVQINRIIESMKTLILRFKDNKDSSTPRKLINHEIDELYYDIYMIHRSEKRFMSWLASHPDQKAVLDGFDKEECELRYEEGIRLVENMKEDERRREEAESNPDVQGTISMAHHPIALVGHQIDRVSQTTSTSPNIAPSSGSSQKANVRSEVVFSPLSSSSALAPHHKRQLKATSTTSLNVVPISTTVKKTSLRLGFGSPDDEQKLPKDLHPATTSIPKNAKLKVPFTKELYVGNLSVNVDDKWLYHEFEKFGVITYARVFYVLDSGSYKEGFGHVKFTIAADAARALEAMQGILIDGRKTKISFYSPLDKDLRDPENELIDGHARLESWRAKRRPYPASTSIKGHNFGKDFQPELDAIEAEVAKGHTVAAADPEAPVTGETGNVITASRPLIQIPKFGPSQTHYTPKSRLDCTSTFRARPRFPNYPPGEFNPPQLRTSPDFQSRQKPFCKHYRIDHSCGHSKHRLIHYSGCPGELLCTEPFQSLSVTEEGALCADCLWGDANAVGKLENRVKSSFSTAKVDAKLQERISERMKRSRDKMVTTTKANIDLEAAKWQTMAESMEGTNVADGPLTPFMLKEDRQEQLLNRPVAKYQQEVHQAALQESIEKATKLQAAARAREAGYCEAGSQKLMTIRERYSRLATTSSQMARQKMTQQSLEAAIKHRDTAFATETQKDAIKAEQTLQSEKVAQASDIRPTAITVREGQQITTAESLKAAIMQGNSEIIGSVSCERETQSSMDPKKADAAAPEANTRAGEGWETDDIVATAEDEAWEKVDGDEVEWEDIETEFL